MILQSRPLSISCEDVDFLCNQERKNLTALMNDVLIYNKDNRFSIIRT